MTNDDEVVTRRSLLTLLGALAPLTLVRSGPARADELYPSRPIRLLVGTSAGGPTDTVARKLAARLEKPLGRPLVVENKDGAAGLIAGQALVRSSPDGYTLQLSSTSNSVLAPMLLPSPGFKVDDLVPVAMVAAGPMVLYVNPDLAAKDLRGLISLMKASPGKLSYGTAGVGSIGHVTAELFNIRSGVQMVHVPFKGAAGMDQAVVAGDIQIGFNTLGSAIGLHKSGRIRILAVFSESRLSSAPDVPTAIDLGVRDLVSKVNFYVMAPRHTPPAVLGKLNAAISEALARPDFQDELIAAQMEPGRPMTIPATTKVFKSEIDQWSHVVRTANLEPK